MQKTVEISLPLLLPGHPKEDEACQTRLLELVAGRRGISQAHIVQGENTPNLCLHYDSDLIGLNDVQSLARSSGSEICGRYRHLMISVPDMDCPDCPLVIDHSLSKLKGIISARSNYPARKVWVDFDTRHIHRRDIEQRLRMLGYSAAQSDQAARWQENRELIFTILCCLFLVMGWSARFIPGIQHPIPVILFVLACIFGGFDITRHAWISLRERHFNTDLLMLLAALGAAAIGEWAEGALLLFLFSLGHVLEERAMDKAREALRGLADNAPQTALLRKEGVESEVRVEELRPGDLIIVRAFEKIAADGVVISGLSQLNQASVTGESMPVEKGPGDSVYAGTINGDTALEVEVSKPASESMLSRIQTLVEEAQAQHSPTQRTVEKFERFFVPAVVILTLAVIVIPPLLGVPFRVSFMRAMTLLVAASPCALALGAPSAVLSAIARAARGNVLIKGGTYLENIGQVNTLAVDKTGTLTTGILRVTDLRPYELTDGELLALASGAETWSQHPVASAILDRARAEHIAPANVTDVKTLAGIGLQGAMDGSRVSAGSLALMDSMDVAIPQHLLAAAMDLRAQGKTLVWVEKGGVLAGLIALADTLRPQAAALVQSLKGLGIQRMVMLSGDHRTAAESIASDLGLTEVRAELLPEQKSEVIDDLLADGSLVAMVGDGINDAPALARATVSIAMGGTGTDIALETADIVLMSDDLSRLPFTIGLGRATRGVIIQNLAIALLVIAMLVIASLFGWIGMGFAVALHEGSTVVVVLNSLRLLNYRVRT